MAFGRVEAGDLLEPHPRPDPPDEVVERHARRRARPSVRGRLEMAAVLAVVERLGLHGEEPQAVDPEA
jgi:hypothetical protein